MPRKISDILNHNMPTYTIPLGDTHRFVLNNLSTLVYEEILAFYLSFQNFEVKILILPLCASGGVQMKNSKFLKIQNGRF